jgi:hypothetical protein
MGSSQGDSGDRYCQRAAEGLIQFDGDIYVRSLHAGGIGPFLLQSSCQFLSYRLDQPREARLEAFAQVSLSPAGGQKPKIQVRL